MDGRSDWTKLNPNNQSEGLKKRKRKSSVDLVRVGVKGNSRWSPLLEEGRVVVSREGAAANQRREGNWDTGEADAIPF